MINKSIFKYSLKFRKLIELNFYHNFFESGLLKKYKIYPLPESLRIMNDYGIIFKTTDSGGVFLSPVDDKFKGTNFKGSINLILAIDFFDPYFLSYTDIPYENDIIIKFENNFKEKLHSGKFVSSKSITAGDENIKGLLKIELNKNDMFFGSNSIYKNKPLTYSSYMNTRDVIIRYNFQIDDKSAKSFYITDEDEKIRLKNFKKRYLASGVEVRSISINKPVKLSEFMKNRFFLKKDDNFFKSYSFPLPSATARNITFDKEKNLFFADVIVNV